MIIDCVKRAMVNHTPKYAYDLNLKLTHVALWLEKANVHQPEKVSLGLVEQFKSEERARGLVDASINRYLDAWKKAMRHGVDEGIAPPRVLTYFRKLREPRPAPHQRGLTMDEIDRFLCAVEDERYYFLFRAVAGSGIRDDEARHLEEQCIQENAIVIGPLAPGLCECHPRGWNSKNFRYRTIPASSYTVAAARSFVAVKHSMVLDYKSVWKVLQAGRKLSDVSRWYGHGDIKTTMRYLRVVEDEMPAPEDLPL